MDAGNNEVTIGYPALPDFLCLINSWNYAHSHLGSIAQYKDGGIELFFDNRNCSHSNPDPEAVGFTENRVTFLVLFNRDQLPDVNCSSDSR